MNKNEKIGYALGISMAQQMIRSGIYEVDFNSLIDGIKDMIDRKEPKMPLNEAAEVLNTFIREKEAIMDKHNKELSDNFMEGNKQMPGIITTESGLQYKVDLKTDKEDAQTPTEDDVVEVNYRGKFLSGEIFNDSYARGHSVKFQLKQVIPAWTEGLQLMKEGDRFTFYVPYQLAYGSGGDEVIPPYSALIFEIELVRVVKENKE